MTMQAPEPQSAGERWDKERRQIFSREALDKMHSPEQLDTVLPITTPIGWMGLLSVAVILLAVVLWSIFGSLTVTAEGMGLIMDAEGVLYLPLEKGKQVRVGQTVHLAPNGVDVSQTGSLLGTVSSVSQYPVSLQDIQKGLESEQLARWIFQTQQGAVMEVRFDRDHQGQWGRGRLLHQMVGLSGQSFGSLPEDRPLVHVRKTLARPFFRHQRGAHHGHRRFFRHGGNHDGWHVHSLPAAHGEFPGTCQCPAGTRFLSPNHGNAAATAE